MAAEEVVTPYLRSKFSSILQEADADPSSPAQIILRFRSIEKKINLMCEEGTTNNRSSSPIIPANLLYDLIHELSECRIFAHGRHKAAPSNKGFFGRWVITFSPLSYREFLVKKNMKRRLDDIETKLNNNNNNPAGEDLQPPVSPPRQLVIQQTYPVRDTSRIIGFESQAKEIERLLLSEQIGLTAIGIVGRKTALAQKIFDSPIIHKEFYPMIWVCLSKMLFNDNDRVDARVRVLNYILEEIGHDTSELEYADFNVIKLLEKLQRGLMGKRYLIVLDDIWRVDEFYADLGYSLPRGYAAGEFFSHGLPRGSGGGVIVTSRSENVIRRTVGPDVIRLEPHLSDDICRNIFEDAVRMQLGKYDHPMVERMEDEIVRSCDGLPLAATTLANIISEEAARQESLWIPSRELDITWINDSRYWKWTSLPPPDDSEEVAELLMVCYLHILGRVDLKKLFILKTSYSAYLVFKLTEQSYGLTTATTQVRFVGGTRNLEGEDCTAFIGGTEMPGERGSLPHHRGKGWMEIKLGDFFNNLGDDRDGHVEAALFEIEETWKSGLLVKGIEVRPN